MARMLFINWTDGAPASQFSVADNTTLEASRMISDRLQVYEVDADAWLALDITRIRSAYLIDLPEASRIISAEDALVEERRVAALRAQAGPAH